MSNTVYIETSIISYLAARSSRNLITAACQELTLTFWDDYKSRYQLFTSELVVEEASGGDPVVAKKRLLYLKGIPELSINLEVKGLAAAILKDKGVPLNAELDAVHIAVAAVNSIDYLLTWNCRHIDNPSTKPIVRFICEKNGYTCPEICTPLELTEDI